MALTLRPTGGPSRVHQHRPDWTIFDEGKPVGRIYEDTSASTSADLRWCWSIRTYVQPNAGIRTGGRVPTLGQAKTEWLRSWIAWRKAQRR
jgi:hypothetical protein